MKGQEIINHITHEKMPDVQQMREICLTQPVQAKRHFKRLRLSTAAAIVAVFVIFASVAYAIVDRAYQRVATGGMWDIVLLPDDDYGRQIYQERNEGRRTGHHVYWALGGNIYTGRINAEAARFINQQLEGQIFASDGSAIDFELAVSLPGILSFGRYHLDDRGNTLYTADGYPVGSISLFRTNDNELYSVAIRTQAQEEEIRGFNSSYEEVRAVLGKALRLPAVHIDKFQPPCFDLRDMWPHLPEPGWHVSVRYTINEITGIFDFCRYEIRIFIENTRGEDGPPLLTMYYLGGEAIARYIAGVTVYELNIPDHMLHFVWEKDGLAYRLTPSPVFTHEQIMEVIYSMVAR